MLDRLKDYISVIAAFASLATAVIVGGGTVPAWLAVAVAVGLGLVAFERHERLGKAEAALAEAQAVKPPLHDQAQRFVDRIDGILRAVGDPTDLVPWGVAERINYLVGEVHDFPNAYDLVHREGAPTQPARSLEPYNEYYANARWSEAVAMLGELRAEVAPGLPWPEDVTARLRALQ